MSSVPYKGEAGWSGLQEFKRDYHLPLLKCVSNHDLRIKIITKKVNSSQMQFSSCVKDNETFSPLLVHNSVATLPAPDGVPWSDLILTVALSTNVDHWGFDWSCVFVYVHRVFLLGLL